MNCMCSLGESCTPPQTAASVNLGLKVLLYCDPQSAQYDALATFAHSRVGSLLIQTKSHADFALGLAHVAVLPKLGLPHIQLQQFARHKPLR